MLHTWKAQKSIELDLNLGGPFFLNSTVGYQDYPRSLQRSVSHLSGGVVLLIQRNTSQVIMEELRQIYSILKKQSRITTQKRLKHDFCVQKHGYKIKIDAFKQNLEMKLFKTIISHPLFLQDIHLDCHLDNFQTLKIFHSLCNVLFGQFLSEKLIKECPMSVCGKNKSLNRM